MKHSIYKPAARDSLRRLTTPHALTFGSRLLRRRTAGVITFREFVAVAREFVTQSPDHTAVYLAALVALDMGSDDCLHEASTPSPN